MGYRCRRDRTGYDAGFKGDGSSPSYDRHIDERRLGLARSLGADIAAHPGKNDLGALLRAFGDKRADVIPDCIATQSTLASAIELARKGTRIVVVGVPNGYPGVNMALVQDRELELLGTFAMLFTRRFAKTAPVAIMNFAAYEGISWGQMAAGAILLTVPVVMFAFLVRRYLVAGLVGGAVKG